MNRMKSLPSHPLAAKFLFLFLTTCLLTGLAHAQQSRMNPYGHFEDVRTRPQALSRAADSALDTLHLLGNSIFRSLNGYITLDGLYENAPVELRVYSPTGELRYQKQYRQMVNMKFSPNRRFIAFHDMERIQLFNTVCLNSKSVEGSNVFAVDNGFNVAYYNEATESVHWMEQAYAAPEAIYKVLIREGQPLFVGYKSIWQIGPSGLEAIFTANEGRVFDAMTDSLTLHVSTKVERPCEFEFTEFTSTGLKSFQSLGTSILPLAHCQHDLSAQPESKTATDELIRDPLHFYASSYPQPIGNSYNEIQEYSLGDPYPHPGVDLLGNYLDSVHSVKNGVVKAILTTSAEWHWRVAISNNNTSSRSQGYLYAHVEETTIPYAVGDAVNEGDVIGYLVDWPVAGFTHCHFARISDQGATWSGNWWTLDNPLKFMTNVTDNTPPAFEYCTAGDLFAFRTIGGTYVTPTALTGSVRVIARFHDTMNSTWHIDVDKVRYSLSPLSNPAQMLIDTLSMEFNHWNDEYFSGPYSSLIISTLYSRDNILYSEGNYDFRHFYHIVTNSDGNDTITANDANQYLVTTDFPNGDYIFRVTAIDPFGLQTTDSMIITFANPSASAPSPIENDGLIVYPNPSGDGIFHICSERPLRYEVCNALGQVVSRGKTHSTDGEIDLSSVAAGIYSLRATDGKTTRSRQLVVQGK